jgi:titin
LSGAHYNYISGNFIGTDPGGQAARGNFNGILLMDSSNNVIGEDSPGLGNIISGNTGYGIHLYGGGIPCTLNTIKGNYIGLAADGITPLPNPVGIRFQGSVSQNTVGGNNAGQRNIISGNSDTGILINAATNNTVSGNYIGTDVSGRVAVGNGLRGIFLDSGANINLIGGDYPSTANVISGNWIGIWVEGVVAPTQGNTIKGNLIGTDPSGLNALRNLDDGIYLGPRAQANYIGPYNIIAFNAGDGVAVDTPTAVSNFITRNRIFGNGGLGINLTNGANGDIPAPVIQSTTFGSIRIGVTACPACAVQVFNSRVPDGEGEVYLGGGAADATGNFTLVVGGIPYPYLTATASDARGTSEFSPVFTSTAYLLHLPVILR